MPDDITAIDALAESELGLICYWITIISSHMICSAKESTKKLITQSVYTLGFYFIFIYLASFVSYEILLTPDKKSSESFFITSLSTLIMIFGLFFFQIHRNALKESRDGAKKQIEE